MTTVFHSKIAGNFYEDLSLNYSYLSEEYIQDFFGFFNDKVYLVGSTYQEDILNPNQTVSNGDLNFILHELDGNSGTVLYSKIFDHSGDDYVVGYKKELNSLYLTSDHYEYDNNGEGRSNLNLFKIDLIDPSNNSTNYEVPLTNTYEGHNWLNGSLIIDQNDLYLTGGTTANVPTTDGTGIVLENRWHNLVLKVNKNNGNILLSTIFQQSGGEWINFTVMDDCNLHFAVESDVTDDIIYYNYNKNLKINKFKSISSNFYKYISNFSLFNSNIYISGYQESNNPRAMSCSNGNFKMTADPFTNSGSCYYDLAIKLDLSPTGFLLNNVITNQIQNNVCILSPPEKIGMSKIYIPGSNLPPLYRNGISQDQNDFEANYQWQYSETGNAPWINIFGAVLKDYKPSGLITTRHFRRLAINPLACGNEIIHTSDVATVNVNDFLPPVLNAGGIFNSCPGTSVTIGGSTTNPTISGGLPGYQISWDYDAAGAVDQYNPIVTPSSSTVYTLTVTDARGCKAIDQAAVNVYQAKAGPDIKKCGENQVFLNGIPIQGLSGIQYAWTPQVGLSCYNCIQPELTGNQNQEYTLTVTVPVTQNQTCETSDLVSFTKINSPLIENFAGDDKTICYPDPIQIGSANESGFAYMWSPTQFLSSSTISNPEYSSNFFSFPQMPDPAIYYLTASKEGCSFIDQIQINVIRADAGYDGCGPRVIGNLTNDVIGLDETFKWEKLINGQYVDLNVNEPTLSIPFQFGNQVLDIGTYRLTTSLNNVSCSDEVEVTGCACSIELSSVSDFGCANANFGSVQLNASIGGDLPPNIRVEWSPPIGLSAYDVYNVNLITNEPTEYTFTIYPVGSTTPICSETILVNQPEMRLPIFDAPDVYACYGQQDVHLGIPNINGYEFYWQQPYQQSLYDYSSSYPLIFPQYSQDFSVQVTDPSDCFIIDQVKLFVNSPYIELGPNQIVCDNSTVPIAVNNNEAFYYSWEPVDASWQLGTGPTDANPYASISVNQYFSVTVTDPLTNCTSEDAIYFFIPYEPTLSVQSITCHELCNGSLTVLPSGNSTYNWSTGETNISIDNLCEGTYSVEVHDQNGCPFYLTEQLLSPAELIVDYETTNPSCGNSDGGAVINVSGGVAPYNYNWSNGQTVSSVTNLTAGIYSVRVTDNSGCFKDITVNLINVGAPTLELLATHPSCFGSCNGSITSNVSGGVSPYSYLWSNQSAQSSLQDLCAGAYSLNVTDAAGCVANQFIDLQDPTRVNISFTYEKEFICQGICDGSVSIAVDGGVSPFSYEWSNGSVGTNINNLCEGNYSLTVTDANSCTGSVSIDIQLKSDPVFPDISDLSICSGNSQQITNPEIQDVIYDWTPVTGLSCTNCAEPTVSTSQLSSNTSYTVTAQFPDACNSLTQTIDVNLGYPTTFTMSDVYFCPQSSQTVSLGDDPNIPDGTTYEWNPVSNFTNPNGRYTDLYHGDSENIYSLKVLETNGCFSTGNVTVKPFFYVNIGATHEMCLGNPLTISNTGTNTNPNLTYSWHPAEMFSSPNTSETDFSTNASGDFEVYLQVDDNSGCIVNAYSTISVHEFLLDVPAIPTTVCSGSQLALGGSSQFGVQYNWTTVPELPDILNDHTIANPTAVVNQETTFDLVATDQNGCQDFRNFTIFIYESRSPVITLEDISVCKTENIQALNAVVQPNTDENTSYTFLWSTSPSPSTANDGTILSQYQNPTNISLISYGVFNYYLTVTNDQSGCQSTVDIQVEIKDCPPSCLVTIEGPNEFCTGQEVTISATGTPPGGQFSWTNGNTTNSYTYTPALSEQTFEITYSVPSTCSDTKTKTLTFNNDCCPNPQINCPDILITSAYDDCDNLITVNEPVVVELTNPEINFDCNITDLYNNHSGPFYPGINEVLWTVTNIEGDISTCTQNVIYTISTGGN